MDVKMDTAELRQRMIDDLALIGYDITEEEVPIDAKWLDVIDNSYVFFEDVENGRWDGRYYFVRDGFYYTATRGRANYLSKPYANLKDFLYEIYVLKAFSLAEAFAQSVNTGKISKNRIIRVKELELLERIDDYYYKKGYEHALEVMQRVPSMYDDGLGLNLDISLLERVTLKEEK